MNTVTEETARARVNKIPDDIYIGFVDSLYIDIRGLLIAGFAMITAALISFVASRDYSLLYCTIFIGSVLIIRLIFMISHARNVPSRTIDIAHRQEAKFLLGAVLFMFSLSLWTFVAFFTTEDAFTRFFTAAITIPYAFGMWTRSFATDRGINAQIIAAFVPLAPPCWSPEAGIHG